MSTSARPISSTAFPRMLTHMILASAIFITAIFLSTRPAAAELSIDGPCVQGHRWTATMINQGGGGLATYNACSPGSDLLVVRCTPGSSAVTARVEQPIAGLTPNQRITGQMIVDGTAYTVAGTAQFSEMLNGSFPSFDLRRGDPIFAAMGAGSRAELRIGNWSMPMHLSGSSNIVRAMFEACP